MQFLIQNFYLIITITTNDDDDEVGKMKHYEMAAKGTIKKKGFGVYDQSSAY